MKYNKTNKRFNRQPLLITETPPYMAEADRMHPFDYFESPKQDKELYGVVLTNLIFSVSIRLLVQ